MNVDLAIKKWSLVWSLWSLMLVVGFAQSTASGKVTDNDTGEELIGANVLFFQEGVYKTGISTDFDGNFHLPIDSGVYDVEVSYIGYPTMTISGIIIEEGKEKELDAALSPPDYFPICCGPVSIGYRIPLIDKENTSSKSTIDAQQIKRGSGKNISDIIIAAPGLSISQ